MIILIFLRLFSLSSALTHNEEDTCMQAIETNSESMNSHDLSFFKGIQRKPSRNSNSSNMSNQEKRLSKDSSSSCEYNQLDQTNNYATVSMLNKSYQLNVTDTSINVNNKSGEDADATSYASANNSFNLDDFQQPKYNSKKSSPSHTKSESKSKKPWYSVSEFIFYIFVY